MLLLLFAAGSMSPSFNPQSTSNVVDTSAGNNPSRQHIEAAPIGAQEPGALNAKATDSCERSMDTADGNKAKTIETENRSIAGHPTVALDPPPTNAAETSQNGNGAKEGLFPDGRIFLEGGPPYGYIPTCTPKGPAGIPTIPIDPVE